MKKLSIKNKLVRALFLTYSLLALTALTLNHNSSSAKASEYIIYPVIAIGFLYIFLTNKIDVSIDDSYLRYKWLSFCKREILINEIKEVYLKRYKIIIRTEEKDIKLDIFNAGRKNKALIRKFFYQNINAPIINKTGQQLE